MLPALTIKAGSPQSWTGQKTTDDHKNQVYLIMREELQPCASLIASLNDAQSTQTTSI